MVFCRPIVTNWLQAPAAAFGLGRYLLPDVSSDCRFAPALSVPAV